MSSGLRREGSCGVFGGILLARGGIRVLVIVSCYGCYLGHTPKQISPL